MLIRNYSFCLTINIITFLSSLSKWLNDVLYFYATNATLKKEIIKTEEYDNSPLAHENNEEINEEVDECLAENSDVNEEINEEVYENENSHSLPASLVDENFYDKFASDSKENGKFFE